MRKSRFDGRFCPYMPFYFSMRYYFLYEGAGQSPPRGFVSLGDLAVERDPGAALGDISAAPPNT
jgi:hypothetical protein